MLRAVNLDHLNLRVRDAMACRASYEAHFGFRLAFEAEGGFFVRNDDGFLLALVPADDHRPLPEGFHVGFGLDTAEAVADVHRSLGAAGARRTEIDDHGPDADYVSFRCWDPDGTEIEVFWGSG
jgi:catechol 2,3-dioxygenase-like lactoylglutathione lyase family enzyme